MLDNIINVAKQKEVNPEAVSAVENKISKLKLELKKKSEAVRSDLEKKKIPKEQIDKDVEAAANNAYLEVLNELKKETQPLINDALTKMRSQVEAELTADWPKDKAAARTLLLKTPNGKKYLKLIDDALNSILKLKETP